MDSSSVGGKAVKLDTLYVVLFENFKKTLDS